MPTQLTLNVVRLGTHHVVNPQPGEPPFLSAASGVVWSRGELISVGDDQAELAMYDLTHEAVMTALRAGEHADLLAPGVAYRIIPDVLPLEPMDRKEHKADFEALTIIRREHIEALQDEAVRAECLRRFPHGLLLVAGSGGVSWGGVRRSIGVVYLLDEEGHILGVPAKVSLEGLHQFLEQHVTGELNIEGVCAHGQYLILAQRGNSIDKATGEPAQNMLIRLSLAKVLKSLYTDLRVDQCELEEVRSYEIGFLPLTKDGKEYEAKLDFTDLDSVEGDPHGRLVFTAAAEGPDDTPIKGEIAGSVVGVIGSDGNIQQIIRLDDPTIKLEGVHAWYDAETGSIYLLLVSDADDPDVPAPLMAARIPA